MGRNGVRRLDGTQALRPRADWLDRGGVGVVRPLPRGRRPWTRSVSGRNNSGWSPSSTNLLPATGCYAAALEEAQLRGAPLRVLTTWQSRFTDIHDGNAVADGNRLAKAQLDRRLAQWKKRYPDLDVRAVAVHGSTLNFLTEERGLDPAAGRRTRAGPRASPSSSALPATRRCTTPIVRC